MAAAVFLSACAAPVTAQMLTCNNRASVLDQLAGGYSETPVAMGLTNGGAVIEILVSSRTGRSWTIILTWPSGLTCLVAAGDSWENIPRIILNGKPT